MKNVFIALGVVALLTVFSSCTKCYVCKDKDSTSLTKVKYCDKDFDKGDIDAIIKDNEADGMTCHRESMIL